MSVNTKTLDHIVHLTPPGTVQETSEQFRRQGFRVIPGGTHADGLTANALVVLKDGVYLELISFTHPPSHYPPSSPSREKRDSHRWASKLPGWIDYAFLGNGSLTTDRISDIINEKANETLYEPEQPGGRTRPDGEVLQWVITAPAGSSTRTGILPFFCGDVTPRSRRVPLDPPSNADHSNAALGIAHIRVLVSGEIFTTTVEEFNSIVGDNPQSTSEIESTWTLDTLHGSSATRLILNTPRNSDEHDFLRESSSGIYEVAFWVEKGDGGTVTTPYGRIVWLPKET